MSGMNELQSFDSAAVEKTNLWLALVTDIRFFANPACNDNSNLVAKFSVSLQRDLCRVLGKTRM